jgi:hypothetical protein
MHKTDQYFILNSSNTTTNIRKKGMIITSALAIVGTVATVCLYQAMN